MNIKIGIFFILTILIPTSLLAYFGLLAIRNEKTIVEKNMRQKYEAMADIADEEIKSNLSRASEKLLTDKQYWEALLAKGADVFKDEIFLFDRQGRPLGRQARPPLERAAFIRQAKDLPYVIAVYELHPHLLAALRDKEENLIFYVSMIIFSVFSILGGSMFTLSALSREWRQAKLKSEFASHLSHDLRRPLTSIRMFSEMLKNGDVPSEEKKKEYYGIISEESDKLTHLANNILDFSRIQEGRRKYNIQPEDITRIVIETVERFKVYTANETRSVTLHQEAIFVGEGRREAGGKNNYPMVKVDAGAISQALMNLLTNADKYSPPEKEVVVNLLYRNFKEIPILNEIVASLLKRKGELILKRKKKYVIIEVVDQGGGIPKEEQKKIFQKFYRASRKDVSEVEGSGLGLALVKYTAQAHGGKVTLKSEAGRGSTFAICLPV